MFPAYTSALRRLSDLDEYEALRAEQRNTADQRHLDFMNLMNHASSRGVGAESLRERTVTH